MAGPRFSFGDLRRARGHADVMSDARGAMLLDSNPLAGGSLALMLTFLLCGWYWADHAMLDEVTIGQGRVVPSTREQIIQSLEGGILAELNVAEGDTVDKGQMLLRIDDTRVSASLRESQARRLALLASIARLRAEAEGGRLSFPDEVLAELREIEAKLYRSRKQALEQALAGVDRSLRLAREELEMTAPLVDKGIVSEVEVLRLRRQVNELRGQILDRRNTFRADARAELASREAELAGVKEVSTARADQVNRTVIRSPVRGIVKEIRLTTVGGVISPGMEIMQIVPLEDRLLVEARIRPSDVAFIRPGLSATVKITAYDFSIYGGLEGVLDQISADTIDEEDPRKEPFYRVRVRTNVPHLDGVDGPLPIIPGMTATVEVLTGRKSVLDYLLKPVLRTRDNALRER